MSIRFRAPAKLNTAATQAQYAPFSGQTMLAPCEICIYEKADGKATFAESAFSRYIDPSQVKTADTVGDYSFAPCGDGVVLWEENNVPAWVHDNYREIDAVLQDADISTRAMKQIIMQAYRYTMFAFGGLLVHSASVIYNGEAILFCGIPGAGKSTQSRLWQETCEGKPLNNDQTAVLWKDGILYAHGTPWSGKEPCFKNEGYPLRAIVFVEKSPTDYVEKLRGVEAFSLLYMNNLIVPVQDGIEDAFTAVVEKLAQAVPVYRQYCTMTGNAPRTLLRELER